MIQRIKSFAKLLKIKLIFFKNKYFFQKLLSIFLRNKLPEKKKNVQYGFNRIDIEKINSMENSCSDEEKYAYFQRTNLDKILDREKLNILSSNADSLSVFKFLQNSYNKQQAKQSMSNQVDKNDLKNRKSQERSKQNAKSNGILNWFSKYPEIEEFENPAMILDEDENLKQKIREKNEQANYFSKLQGKMSNCQDQLEESQSINDLNDTLVLKSASQVPMNLPFNNPSYLYEEQEGSVDLRSECSFLAKNNSFLNNNLSKNNKQSQNPKNTKNRNEAY